MQVPVEGEGGALEAEDAGGDPDHQPAGFHWGCTGHQRVPALDHCGAVPGGSRHLRMNPKLAHLKAEAPLRLLGKTRERDGPTKAEDVHGYFGRPLDILPSCSTRLNGCNFSERPEVLARQVGYTLIESTNSQLILTQDLPADPSDPAYGMV
jgi:hypothetical protein